MTTSTHSPLDQPGPDESPGRFPCPHCGQSLSQGTPSCTECGLRLVGVDAARLWQVNQQISALRSEADALIARLLQPAPAADPSYAGPGTLPPYPAAPGRPPRKPLSGQQILLGLGALLLLSGASFFLLVVWLVIGVAGQALIMAVLTGVSVVAGGAAARRRLPAAAQTAGVIATGLLVLDLWAAHNLGLAGLDRLPGDAYWTVAGLLGGALLLGFDRSVPRHDREGAPLRRTWIYRPAASALLSVAAVSAVAALDPGSLALCGLAFVLAALGLAGVAAARRFDLPEPVQPGLEARAAARSLPWSAVPPLLVTFGAAAVHLLAGVLVGLDPASTGAERYAAVGLLLLAPVALLVVAALPVAAGGARVRRTLCEVALLLAVPATGIVLADAHRVVVVVASFALAALLVAAVLVRRSRPRVPSALGLPAAELLGWISQPVLLVLVLVVADADAVDGLALLAGETGSPAPWWLAVLPAVAWSLAAVSAAALIRTAGRVVLAQVAVLATLFTAARDAGPVVQVVVVLVACAASLALAGVARALPDSEDTRVVDGSAVLFAGLYGLVAILVGAEESPHLLAAALVVTGACTLAYSGSRERLGFAYPGALLVTAGVGVLLHEVDVHPVEAYSATLVLLLAGIGFVQQRRDPSAPTMLTMAPALAAALLPTLYVGIEEGGELRLAASTLAGVLVLVAGLRQHWRGPVTVGAVVLVLVAVTQGGPLISWIPSWINLIVAGAVLLWIGVAWEKAVLAGRRTAGWYATLR